jgi:Cu/Ag efflux protein CusF
MIRRAFVLAVAAGLVAFATPALADEKEGTHEGKVVKAEKGKLTMTDKDGKKEHSHDIGADAKITMDGKEAKLEDLKAGTMVKVTAEKKGDKVVVTKVEAKKDDK